MTVEEEAATGWWFIIKADKSEGWAPADYLDLTGSNSDSQPGAPAKPAKPSKPSKPSMPAKPSRPGSNEASSNLRDDEFLVLDTAYNADGEGELSLRPREKVTVLEKATEWWFCRNAQGQEGWYVAHAWH